MKRDLKEEEEAMQGTGGRASWQMAETSLCKGSEAGKTQLVFCGPSWLSLNSSKSAWEVEGRSVI